MGDLTEVGSYSGSPGPYGSFDQGGNVYEWNETLIAPYLYRGARAGSFESVSYVSLAASARGSRPTNGRGDFGFRLVMIPEPGTGVLAVAGLLCLAGSRRMRE